MLVSEQGCEKFVLLAMIEACSLLQLVCICTLQGSQLENVLGAQRQKFVQLIARELHRDQPWFHGSIERETADMVMLESGHQDGKFL